MKEIILEEQMGGTNKPNFKWATAGTMEKPTTKINEPATKKAPKVQTKSKPIKKAPKVQPKKTTKTSTKTSNLDDILNKKIDEVIKKQSKKSKQTKPKKEKKVIVKEPKQKLTKQTKTKAKKEKPTLTKKKGGVSEKTKQALHYGIESLPLIRVWHNMPKYAKKAGELYDKYRAWRNERELRNINNDDFEDDPGYTNVDKPIMDDPGYAMEAEAMNEPQWAQTVNPAEGNVIENPDEIGETMADPATEDLLAPPPPRPVPTGYTGKPRLPTDPEKQDLDYDDDDVADDAEADAGDDAVGDALEDVGETLAEDLAFGRRGKLTKKQRNALIKSLIKNKIKKAAEKLKSNKKLSKLLNSKGGNFWDDLVRPFQDAGDWLGDQIIKTAEIPYTLGKAIFNPPSYPVSGRIYRQVPATNPEEPSQPQSGMLSLV